MVQFSCVFVLFYRRILRGSDVLLRSLLHQKVGYVQSLLSKFNIQSLLRPKHELKLHIGDTFVSETVCRGHFMCYCSGCMEFN